MSRSKQRGRRNVLIAALFLSILALGAYGAIGCGEGGGGTDTTEPLGDSIKHPTGPKEIVLRISSAGGFVPVSYALTQIPEFTLYGDGTVVVTGPMIEIYPGPAMPNLQTAKISEDAIQAILSAAREAGLFASGFDYGQPGITDMNTTSITINADGKTYQADIYALGAEAGAGGMTMEQQQARAAVADLAGKLQILSDFQTGEIKWASYQYTALAVFSLKVDPNYTPDPNDVQPNTLEWPLGDLSTIGTAVQPDGYRKVVVTGKDLKTLQPLLSEATQITIWTVGDNKYNLHFRPLLPDEAE